MELGFALAVAAAGLAGLYGARVLRDKLALRSAGFGFATGTLLSMVLLHVIPEAMAGTSHAMLLMVAGFVAMLLAHQHGLQADPCCGHDDHARHAGLPSFLALCLCSINDGVVLYSDIDRGFASPLLWAMCVHKATAAFALLMLLRELGALGGRRRATAILLGYLLMTPLALLLAAQVARWTTLWAPLLALSAGALLYVIAGSLVPRVEHLARERVGPVLSTFLIAIAVNAGVLVLAPHDHAHAHGHDHSHAPAPELPTDSR